MRAEAPDSCASSCVIGFHSHKFIPLALSGFCLLAGSVSGGCVAVCNPPCFGSHSTCSGGTCHCVDGWLGDGVTLCVPPFEFTAPPGRVNLFAGASVARGFTLAYEEGLCEGLPPLLDFVCLESANGVVRAKAAHSNVAVGRSV